MREGYDERLSQLSSTWPEREKVGEMQHWRHYQHAREKSGNFAGFPPTASPVLPRPRALWRSADPERELVPVASDGERAL